MTYAEKQDAILKRLGETNYEVFDNDKKEAMDFVSYGLTTIADYATVAAKTSIIISLSKERNNADTAKKAIEDKNRAYKQAVANINMLNKICKDLGIELFMDINTKNETEILDAINDYITEMYKKGIASGH